MVRRSLASVVTLLIAALGIACGSSTPKAGNPAYVTVRGTNQVFVFTLNGAGGLKAVSKSPFVTGTSPSAVAVHPSGKFVYVANSADATVWVYTVDTTGGLTQTSQTTVGLNPSALIIDAGGNLLFVANEGSDSVAGYSIDSSTGALTQAAGSLASTSSPVALALTPSGKFLYVANANTGSLSGFSISTGALAPLAGLPVAVGANPSSVAIDEGGRFLYVSSVAASGLWGSALMRAAEQSLPCHHRHLALARTPWA
jgi:6-phosphogluconolactonase (cycloisomerase 2 family)